MQKLEYMDRLFQLAKRHRNSKRSYLLVNPYQAKHIPVSPGTALTMMRQLGEKLADKYTEITLVVGFAETATAVGTVVASAFGSGCVYLHTTREVVISDVSWIPFSEEHSHAVEHMLYAPPIENLKQPVSHIILVDDEISTGKTVRNMVYQIRDKYTHLRDTTFIAASLINRVSESDEKKMLDEGIVCEYLKKVPNEDYGNCMDMITAEAPASVSCSDDKAVWETVHTAQKLLNPRTGTDIAIYTENCVVFAEEVADKLCMWLKDAHRLLVLGTEECMYPALIVGEVLESQGKVVLCHATTRSPIGICRDEDYPIRSGYILRSFYDPQRTTYIYNLQTYDAVLVVTDSMSDVESGMEDLVYAAKTHHNKSFIIIRG